MQGSLLIRPESPVERAGSEIERNKFGLLTVFWGVPCGLEGKEKRREGPSCCLEAVSCSHTHFTGVGMRSLEGSPAVQGNHQGLRGTAQHPQSGGKGGRRATM